MSHFTLHAELGGIAAIVYYVSVQLDAISLSLRGFAHLSRQDLRYKVLQLGATKEASGRVARRAAKEHAISNIARQLRLPSSRRAFAPRDGGDACLRTPRRKEYCQAPECM